MEEEEKKEEMSREVTETVERPNPANSHRTGGTMAQEMRPQRAHAWNRTRSPIKTKQERVGSKAGVMQCGQVWPRPVNCVGKGGVVG